MAQPLNQDYQVTTHVYQQGKVLSFADRAHQYRKHHLSDELIERANKLDNATSRTSVISKTTQAIVAIARQKLCKTRTEWFMSDPYMEKVTKCGSRQNRNIIGQIKGTKFNIKRDRKRKGWVFKPLVIEHTKRKKTSELESAAKPIKKGDIAENSIYKNNSSKRTRSNVQAHEAKFFNNSNSSNSLSEQAETIKTKKLTTEPCDTKALISKKKPLANTRKKVTNSERVIRYHKFKAYDKPKNLNQHYPLSQEDCYELQKRSSKAYNLNAMNEILLDMSRKPELQGHLFISKAKFMCYMTKAYQEEGRDVDKANVHSFKIVKRRPQAEIKEIVTLNQREKYLNEAENSGIFARCDYTQVRAKIAGQFPINLGYELLTNLYAVKKNDTLVQMFMTKEVPLTEHYRQLLLAQVNAVGGYAGVEESTYPLLSVGGRLITRIISWLEENPEFTFIRRSLGETQDEEYLKNLTEISRLTKKIQNCLTILSSDFDELEIIVSQTHAHIERKGKIFKLPILQTTLVTEFELRIAGTKELLMMADRVIRLLVRCKKQEQKHQNQIVLEMEADAIATTIINRYRSIPLLDNKTIKTLDGK